MSDYAEKSAKETGAHSRLNSWFGIDFGTTNCATVGRIPGNEDSPIEEIQYGDEEGRPYPSVVAIDKNTGEVYTGREAWSKKVALSESCEYIPSIKTVISENITYKIAGKKWTPVDIAAELFKALRKNVLSQSRLEMNEAVVAVPVGFSAQKRANVRAAAEKAGIKVSSFISEPTAAYFTNYREISSASNIAVFDWGGGTLDVCILQNRNGEIAELAKGGMNVAGDAIDLKIAERLHTKIARRHGKESSFNDMPSTSRDMLLVRAERAKCALSDEDMATVSLNNYGEYGACRESMDYDWFVDIIDPEVTAAINCLKKAIDESEIGMANIDRVLMVGGSSNLRPLIERMQIIFGDKLYFPDDVMWNVAQGASQLAETPGEYFSNQNLGIVLSDGNHFNLLKSGEPLKSWKKECTLGIVDNARQAKFIFTGSSELDQLSDRVLMMPVYGFLQEELKLRAFIDEDLVFNAVVTSSMGTSRRAWNYSGLRFYYRIPESSK